MIDDNEQGLALIERGIRQQDALVRRWQQPKSALLFELVRALDRVFMGDLFVEPGGSIEERASKNLRSFGVNRALEIMVPDDLYVEQFKLFPSSGQTQAQADELLLQAGMLQRAKKIGSELRSGLISSRVEVPRGSSKSSIKRVLAVSPSTSGYYAEQAAYESRQWMQEIQYESDKPSENALEKQHFEVLPELVRNVDRYLDWGMTYRTSREIDEYFLEWGRIYLRRMWGQDLVGIEDKIGPSQFNEYLGILVGLAGRAQKHLCYASILGRRHPDLDIRNLLTTFSPYDEFLIGLAEHMNAYRLQVQQILESLTLSPHNRDIHTASGDMAWAPLIRSSTSHLILPLYGLEHNPFRFLLRDLKSRYASDWFRAVNQREARWQKEIGRLFAGSRWEATPKGIMLKDGGKIVTDIDMLIYDKAQNTALLMQLKWQDPVGLDDKARLSAAKNFRNGGNKWVETTMSWLDSHGAKELGIRSGTGLNSDTQLCLIVLGRYFGPIGSLQGLDSRATWADWATFLKARSANPNQSFRSLCDELESEAGQLISSYYGDSYAFPLGTTAVVFEPKGTTPKRTEIIYI